MGALFPLLKGDGKAAGYRSRYSYHVCRPAVGWDYLGQHYAKLHQPAEGAAFLVLIIAASYLADRVL